MSDDTELVRRVAELAEWVCWGDDVDWDWCSTDDTETAVTYAKHHGGKKFEANQHDQSAYLTDSGLIVLIEELLRAGWDLDSRVSDGDARWYGRKSDGEWDYISEADTLAKATCLAYIAMKEQQP